MLRYIEVYVCLMGLFIALTVSLLFFQLLIHSIDWF